MHTDAILSVSCSPNANYIITSSFDKKAIGTRNQHQVNAYAISDNYENLDFVRTEIGWTFLCWIFQPIGFFGMIIVLTIFEYIVIYRLIKKYIPKDWYWFSVLIFTLNTNNMLVFGFAN